jgi:hypothetical protein
MLLIKKQKNYKQSLPIKKLKDISPTEALLAATSLVYCQIMPLQVTGNWLTLGKYK